MKLRESYFLQYLDLLMCHLISNMPWVRCELWPLFLTFLVPSLSVQQHKIAFALCEILKRTFYLFGSSSLWCLAVRQVALDSILGRVGFHGFSFSLLLSFYGADHTVCGLLLCLQVRYTYTN